MANISFLISFLHSVYFIISKFYFIHSWHLFHSPTAFVSFTCGMYLILRECHGFINPCGLASRGGGRCGCRLDICNPSLTHTRDMGSRVLPVSLVGFETVCDSTTLYQPPTNDDRPPCHETGTTAHKRPQLPPCQNP